MALTKIGSIGINTGIAFAGVTTIATLNGSDAVLSVGGTVNFVSDVSIGGTVSIAGTLTYEDVTNVDAVGLITARDGIKVGSGITLSVDGDIFATGVVTATTFSGSVSAATGDFSIADKIVHTGDTDTAIRFPSADTITAETGGTERLRITSDGKYQFPGTGGGSGARGLEIDTESIGAADEGVILNARASGTTGQIKLQTNGATAVTVEGNGGNVNVASNLKVTGVSTATSFSDSKGDLRSIPANSQSGAYVAVAADAGKAIYISTGGVTINDSVFSAGDAVTIINNSGSNQTITQGTNVTLYNSADGTTGNRTLAGRGMATIWFISAGGAYISGAGLS